MVRGKRILSISERETLAEEKRELEGELRSAEDRQWGGSERVDKAGIKQQIEKIGQALHDGTAPKVTGVRKDDMRKRADELLEKIKDGMPTRFEMDFPHKCPGAVGKHMKWMTRNAANIDEWKRIMRTLEPEDPTGVDLEKHRREK